MLCGGGGGGLLLPLVVAVVIIIINILLVVDLCQGMNSRHDHPNCMWRPTQCTDDAALRLSLVFSGLHNIVSSMNY